MYDHGKKIPMWMAGILLALVLILATRGRLGCQNQADTLPKDAAVPQP